MRHARNGAYPTRVLLAVERCPRVLAWAEAARAGKTCSAADAEPVFPKGVRPDHSYAPIPCGSGSAGDVSFALAAPHESERFAVRGYIDAAHPAEIPHEIDGRPVFSDPPVSKYRVCAESDCVGSKETVETRLNIEAFRQKGLDGSGVAVAIMDSGIYLPRLTELLGSAPSFSADDSWRPGNLALGPGEYPVDHGTMCAFASLIAAPKATLLDYPVLLARGADEHSAQATVSAALDAYARLQEVWRSNLQQKDPKYRALVVNNSWGIFHRDLDFEDPGHPGRYVDNPNHLFHQSVAALARANVDILFAAGNCGSECPDNRCAGHTTGSIMGANAYTEVLTVAGCDITDTRVEYSSQGPSIAGMPQQKPDVTSYTHFKGSEIFGPGTPDGGTSTACAVAAGCVAAARTKLSPARTPPDALFALLKNTARRDAKRDRDPWNPDYGYGVMDPWEAIRNIV